MTREQAKEQVVARAAAQDPLAMIVCEGLGLPVEFVDDSERDRPRRLTSAEARKVTDAETGDDPGVS